MTESFSSLRESKAAGIQYYPSDLDRGPFMKFTTYAIKGGAAGGGAGSGLSDISYGPPLKHVCLPIPSGVNAQYGQSWDQKDVSIFESVGGNIGEMGKNGELAELGINVGTAAADALLAVGGYRSPSSAVASVQRAAGSVHSFTKGITNKGFKEVLDAAKIGAVGSLLGAQAQRTQGKAGFTNTYMTYGGPGFRQFSFSYSLKALSESDTQSIKDVVNFFKQNSYPKLLDGGLWRIYELPKVFHITFHKKDGWQNYKLPRIGKCALTNIGVTYGGAKYSEFENSTPVQTNITLSFKEMALLSRKEIELGY